LGKNQATKNKLKERKKEAKKERKLNKNYSLYILKYIYNKDNLLYNIFIGNFKNLKQT
jgi:hypothetical protein